MKLLITHLSDLHIKSENDSFMSRIEKLGQSIGSQTSGIDEHFLVFTGDVTDSGKSNEYLIAQSVLDRLVDILKTYQQKDPYFVILPGNHDCHLTKGSKGVREAVFNAIQDGKLDDGMIKHCCQSQRQFRNFAAKWQNPTKILYQNQLLTHLCYEINQKTIVFCVYNSAWMSQKEEDPGSIYFPLDKLKRIRIPESDITVSALHHTFPWFNKASKKIFSSFLEEHSSMILTGHEHNSALVERSDLHGDEIDFIEGDALQIEENPELSGYNSIEIDLTEKNYRVINSRWNGKIYEKGRPSALKLVKPSIGHSSHVNEINDTFQKSLDEVGSLFHNPYKEEIKLEDIFVFPYLREIIPTVATSSEVLIDATSSSLLLRDQINDAFRILLAGDDKCGKSSLCKRIFQYYLQKGYIPIYVNGGRLRSANIERFNALVSHCYIEQYSEDNLGDFLQQPPKRVMIIIDDFDKIPINLDVRNSMLSGLKHIYPNIVLTVNRRFPFEEFLYGKTEDDTPRPLQEYEQYRILPFGNLLRRKLATAWYNLGKDVLGEREIINKVDQAVNEFNWRVKRNVIPSYPIFLLVVLQLITDERKTDLRTSSQGHYFTYLITDILSRILNSSDKLEAHLNFLSEFSNHLFEKGIRTLPIEQFNDFHNWYCNFFKISDSLREVKQLNELVSILENSRLIEKRSDGYMFRQRFIYFYFAAKYLADHLSEKLIRTRVRKMCNRLYIDEFANIMMFLTYHSKDPFILNEIIKTSRKLFENNPIAKLEMDVCGVNDMVPKLPEIVLRSVSPQEHREHLDKLEDKRYPNNDVDQYGFEYEEEIPHLNQPILKLETISKIRLGFQIIELLGHVLKNYHGSMTGDRKFELMQEAYHAGLRSLYSVFEYLKKDEPLIANWMKSVSGLDKIFKDEKLTPSEIAEIMNTGIFHVWVAFSWGFLYFIASYVGSQHLSETYKDVLKTNDYNSVRLIDLQIQLRLDKFPWANVKNLEKQLRGKNLPLAILREMVVDFIYMYPTRREDKQRIHSLFNILISTQRLIDMRSLEKE